MALTVALAFQNTSAQNVTFAFADGIYDEGLKAKVEQNISLFLTNINKASRQGADKVDLDGVQITAQAKESFEDLWEFMPFKCVDNANVQSCIQTVTGYNVREIPVKVTDKDTKDEPSTRELTIGFNSKGQITSADFALEQHDVNSILQTGRHVKDYKERMEILNFVERYRSYYDQKDIASLENIFSDDAIIISGTVGMVRTKEGGMVRKVTYNQQNKQQYLDKLKRIFKQKSYIRVKFNNIEVISHRTRDDIYLVRLFQNWRTPGYEDNGYVTLLWQFPKDGDDPRIMVRVWQDENIIKSGDGKIYNLTDFKIY